MKSDPELPELLEGLRRLEAVEPMSEVVTLLLDVAREETSLALVEDPDISLKRLVVPRVAPMLEAVVLLELVEVVELAVEEESLLVVELELEVVEEEDVEAENVRYRSLRLPRSCGAMTVANRSASIVPATRIERCTSPTIMPAVRITAVAFLSGVDFCGRVFR